MRIVCVAALSSLLLLPNVAVSQIKRCEELRAEIDAKLKKNGVKNYTLEIHPFDAFEGDPEPVKIVGRCEGGTKIIVYTRK